MKYDVCFYNLSISLFVKISNTWDLSTIKTSHLYVNIYIQWWWFILWLWCINSMCDSLVLFNMDIYIFVYLPTFYKRESNIKLRYTKLKGKHICRETDIDFIARSYCICQHVSVHVCLFLLFIYFLHFEDIQTWSLFIVFFVYDIKDRETRNFSQN